MNELNRLVEKAILAVIPADQLVERKLRPESTISWKEPTPAAGLTAALAVVKAAQQQAYKFVLGLRGEGTSWREVADLLEVPWTEGQSRTELAYDLVLGPASDSISPFATRNLYWHCRGPLGCGKYITDRGPYNGHPDDNEDGHDADCRRHAAEGEAYILERERQEERDRIADKAMDSVTDPFGQETVGRARRVLARGGQYGGWSTSEATAVALVLNDDEQLTVQGYRTRAAAIDRVLQGMLRKPADAELWLATIRAAATGEIDHPELSAKLGI